MNSFIKKYGEDIISLLFKKKLITILIWSMICFANFIIKFTCFIYEDGGGVIRDFKAILCKYIFETLCGPIYVIIYCHTKNTLPTFFKILLCKKEKGHCKNSIGEALSLSKAEEPSTEESIDINMTLY